MNIVDIPTTYIPDLPYTISWSFPEVKVNWSGYPIVDNTGFNSVTKSMKLTFSLLTETEKNDLVALLRPELVGLLKVTLSGNRQYTLVIPQTYTEIKYNTLIDDVNELRYNISFQAKIVR